ncbi:Uncharacterised protein [Mycobacteroides abscessus subsp. abscessus]|nr:Uncharacterised protein [Mycobacteroides abscessus subsp. abscessus]
MLVGCRQMYPQMFLAPIKFRMLRWLCCLMAARLIPARLLVRCRRNRFSPRCSRWSPIRV